MRSTNWIEKLFKELKDYLRISLDIPVLYKRSLRDNGASINPKKPHKCCIIGV